MSNASDFVIEKGYLGNPDVVVVKKYTGTDPHVVIPDGITRLDWFCFNIPIESIVVPETLTSLDMRAFCDKGTAFADSDGFCKVGCHLVNYIGNAEVLQIPEGIKTITFCAIAGNKTLKKVIIPDSVEVIDNQAFSGCSALEEVLFTGNSQSLRKIEYGAFSGCVNLRSINVPDSVTSVASGAFHGCNGLKDSNGFLIVGKILVSYSGEEEDIVVPNGVVVIADDAFKGKKLKSAVLPDGVQHIGHNAFFMMKTLESVSIPDSVEMIGGNAFCWCENLQSINLAGVKTIGHGAFKHCTSLASPVFSEVLIEIADEAFSECAKITKIRFPSTLKKLGHDTSYNKDSYSGGAFRNTNITSIELPEALEILGHDTFCDCKKLKTAVICGKVQTVGSRVFYNCRALESVSIGDGVEIIEQEAFSSCYALKNLVIPNSVTEIRTNAFLRCPQLPTDVFPQKVVVAGGPDFLANVGIGDENGCIIKDATLVSYVGEPGVVRITEGVERINAGVFNHLFAWRVAKATTEIILPDSLVYFDENNLPRTLKINIPKGFLQRREKQPAKFLLSLLSSPWTHEATPLDYVCVLLFQGGKEMNELCKKRLGWKPKEAAEAFLEATSFGLKGPEYVKGAEFIFEHKDKTEQKTIDAFYACAKNAKAKKAVDLLRPIATEEEDAPQKCAKAVAQHPIEEFCQEQFVEHYLDKTVKKANLYAKSFEGVLYKGSDKKAPAFVVKCAIVPYIALMEERPKHIGGYKTDHLPVSFIENADKVAAELDPVTFIQALEKIASVDFMGYDKPQCLIPLCRYGNENHIKELVSKLRQWENWNSCGSSGRSAIIVARGAIMLNDSREAMLYIEKCKKLYTYARMRGMDEDVLRDTKLAEFGLDANGCKIFDLGNTTIEASVGQDLAISLYDVTAKKIVKSLPKKGADPDKHAAASAQLSDLKKNLKKVVKSRNDILFERFLDGKTQKAPGWIASYTKNPVLHRVAELIVWNQEKNTFILTKNGAVDCDGNTYLISDGSPVGVAHPKDMTKAELAAWQKYFTSHGLKQPFEQIWEPVVDSKSIQTDRYKGYMIPFFRFKGREKHGIFIQDWDFHNQIDISFEGCDANVERIDWRRHDISMDDRFEITSFSIGRSLTRKVNHIVAYLDRITVYGRILNDDVSVVGMLPMFTLAQIMEFINAASENNCTNVLAVLMDYKNRTFVDFDPMEEFSLDL